MAWYLIFRNKYRQRALDAIARLEKEKKLLEAEKGKYNISLAPENVVKIIVKVMDIDKKIELLKSLL